MKRTATKSLRSGLAFVLVLCMMLSLCGAALATEEKDPVDDLADRALHAFNEILALIDEYGPDYTNAEVWDYAQSGGYTDELLDAYDDLRAIADDEIEAFKDTIDADVLAKIKEARLELIDIKNKLIDTSSSLRANLYDHLTKLRDQLEKKYGELDQEEASQEIKDEVKADLDKITGLIHETEDLIQKVNDEANALTDEIDAINKKLDNVNNVLEGLGEDYRALKEAVQSVNKGELTPEALAAESDARARKILKACRDAYYLYGDIQDAAEDASELLRGTAKDIKDSIAKVKKLYHELTDEVSEVRALLAPVIDRVKDEAKAWADETIEDTKGIQAKIDALQAEFDEQSQAILDAAAAASHAAVDSYENHKAELRAELNKLYKELEEAGNLPQELKDAHDDVKAREDELQLKLSKLREELADDSREARKDVEAEIEKVQAEIDETQATVTRLNQEILEAEQNAKTLTEEIQKKIDKVKAEYKHYEEEADKVIAQYMGEANDEVDALNEKLQEEIRQTYQESQGYFDDAKDAGRDAAKAYDEGVDAAVEELTKFVDAKTSSSLIAALESIADIIDNTVERMVADAEQIQKDVRALKDELIESVKACKKIILDAYPAVSTGEYELKSANYYVALGDDSAVDGVPELLAAIPDFDFEESNYVNLAKKGSTSADLLAALKSGSGEIVEAVKKADLITVSYNPSTLAALLTSEKVLVSPYYTPDWSKYVGSKAPYMESIFAALYAELKHYASADTASIAVNVITCYVESYLNMALTYGLACNEIHKLNEDALVVVVGSYNSYRGYKLAYGSKDAAYNKALQRLRVETGTTMVDADGYIDIGWFFEQLNDFIDGCYIVYATNTDKTTFVRLNSKVVDPETILSSEIAGGAYPKQDLTGAGFADILAIAGMFNTNNSIVLTDKGKTNVSQAIYNALDLFRNVLKGDVDDNKIVDLKDLALYRQYLATADADEKITINKWNADIQDDDAQDLKDIVMMRQGFATEGGIKVDSLKYADTTYDLYYGNTEGNRMNVHDAIVRSY